MLGIAAMAFLMSWAAQAETVDGLFGIKFGSKPDVLREFQKIKSLDARLVLVAPEDENAPDCLALLDKEGKVKLLIATKTQSAEDINYLISLGADLIGENRVNEVREKYELLDRRASLHLIGSLQRNKVKYIYDKVDMIHSVDSLSLAEF